MTVAYLPHSFDLFNVEHLELIRAARALHASVVLAVLTDDEVVARSGRPPVVPLEERLEIVRHVRDVDAVVVHGAGPVPRGAAVLVVGDGRGWPGSEPVEAVRTSTSVVLQHALRDVSSAA